MTLDYTRRVTPPGAPKRGWFITIEGPEGAGRRSYAQALWDGRLDAGTDAAKTAASVTIISGGDVHGRLSCHETPKRSLTQPNRLLNP